MGSYPRGNQGLSDTISVRQSFRMKPPSGLFRYRLFAALSVVTILVSCRGQKPGEAPPAPRANGGLIPASSTMVTAWTFPMNPMTDSTLDSSPFAEQVRWGFRLFTNTSEEARRFSPNGMTCNNCHLNAGQKELALPLVGVAASFPEYNKRAGRLFSLEDRILGCFNRSMSAIGRDSLGRAVDIPKNDSNEILALSAYLTWLSRGYPIGTGTPWRKQSKIDPQNLLSMERLDPQRGEELFVEKCSNCHGLDGQGVWIGDKKAGPLWGPDSWNDGAGAARIYTLAGIIRYMMPYMNPGSLTDEEAQHISSFINSKERPEYPDKALDYRTEPLPVDAVYYPH